MVDWGKASVDIRQIRRHSRSPVTLVPVEYARQRAEAIMRAGERRWAGTTNPGRPGVRRGPGLPAVRRGEWTTNRDRRPASRRMTGTRAGPAVDGARRTRHPMATR